jgi:hypothetical protein
VGAFLGGTALAACQAETLSGSLLQTCSALMGPLWALGLRPVASAAFRLLPPRPADVHE